jgi:hypothetical protein
MGFLIVYIVQPMMSISLHSHMPNLITLTLLNSCASIFSMTLNAKSQDILVPVSEILHLLHWKKKTTNKVNSIFYKYAVALRTS